MIRLFAILFVLSHFQLFSQAQPDKLELYNKDSIISGYQYLKNDSSICYSEFDSIQHREIFWYTNEMPIFGDTITDLMNYIQSNLRYPLQGDIEGTVYLKVIVEPDGKLSDIKVVRGIEPLIDKEALAVITNMPPWKAGKCDGIKVPVYFLIPVRFTLN